MTVLEKNAKASLLLYGLRPAQLQGGCLVPAQLTDILPSLVLLLLWRFKVRTNEDQLSTGSQFHLTVIITRLIPFRLQVSYSALRQ